MPVLSLPPLLLLLASFEIDVAVGTAIADHSTRVTEHNVAITRPTLRRVAAHTVPIAEHHIPVTISVSTTTGIATITATHLVA